MKGLRLVVIKDDKSVMNIPIRIEDQVFTLLTLDWGVPNVVSSKDFHKIEDCLFSVRNTIIESYIKHHLDLDYPTDYKDIDVDINNGMTEVMIKIFINETDN
jgi:hypothetical protein